MFKITNWLKRGSTSNAGQASKIIGEAQQRAVLTQRQVTASWGTPTKGPALVQLAFQCPTISICAQTNASIKASFVLRMYKKAGAPVSQKARRIGKKQISRQIKSAYFSERAGPTEEVIEHPFLSLYRDAGPLLWNLSFTEREILGNSYIYVVRDADGLPVGFDRLYSQYIVPIVDASTGKLLRYAHRVADGITRDMPLELDEVLHLRFSESMTNSQEGVSWVEKIVPNAQVVIAANAVEYQTYNDGCFIPFAILVPESGNVAKTREMREQINARHSGAENAGKFMVLEGASSIQPLTSTFQQMNNDVLVERHERKIRNAAGITEAQVNLNTANLASAQFAESYYFRQTIRPALMFHAEQLTAWMTKEYDHNPGDYWLTYDEIVESDIRQNAQTAKDFWTTGVYQLDEVRTQVGLSAIGGEKGKRTFFETQAALGMSAPVLPAPAPKPQPEPEKPATEEAATKALSDGFTKLLDKLLEENETPAPTVEKKKPKLLRGKAIPVPPEALAEIKTIIEEWVKEASKSGEFKQEGLAGELQPVLSRIFREGAQQGPSKLSDRLDATAINNLVASFDVLPADALKFLQNYTIRLAETLTENGNAALKEAISGAVEQGDTPKEARDRVLQSLGDRSEAEASRIARTEVNRAFLNGNLASWAAAGVWGKKWFLDPSDSCPICAAISRKFPDAIPLEQPFFELGEALIVPGRETPYLFSYSAIDCPPGHPHCECTLLPVWENPSESSGGGAE